MQIRLLDKHSVPENKSPFLHSQQNILKEAVRHDSKAKVSTDY